MPDTNGYLVLGLIVVFGTLASYLGSLLARFSSARKDIQLLQQLREE